jgi:hypothetical protein
MSQLDYLNVERPSDEAREQWRSRQETRKPDAKEMIALMRDSLNNTQEKSE